MLEPDWQTPDPPGVKPVKGRNPWVPVIVLGVLLALVVAALYIPIPIFWRYVPGVVEDVEDLVKVEGATDYSSDGSLYLTTVSIDDSVTFAEWVVTAFDDETAVVLKEDVTGGGTEEELLEEARIQMRDSKAAARQVALGKLGLLQPSARIERVSTDSPASDRIQIGDVILAIDGKPMFTVCEVASEIRKHPVGDPIEVTLKRDGREVTLQLETAALNPDEPDLPMIGIAMDQLTATVPEAPDIEIDTGRIGGPSAGLMFALAIYDRLTPDDITHGREIAGTGVINCDGSVLPIGGIEQKIAAAEDKGAEIFLAPAGNFEAAEQVADEIDVVSIGTFDDAVEYLAALK